MYPPPPPPPPHPTTLPPVGRPAPDHDRSDDEDYTYVYESGAEDDGDGEEAGGAEDEYAILVANTFYEADGRLGLPWHVLAAPVSLGLPVIHAH
jgi:hypothetical protein